MSEFSDICDQRNKVKRAKSIVMEAGEDGKLITGRFRTQLIGIENSFPSSRKTVLAALLNYNGNLFSLSPASLLKVPREWHLAKALKHLMHVQRSFLKCL